MDLPIWMNSRIRIDGRPVFWASVFKSGLVWISQLYEEGEPVSSALLQQLYNMSAFQAIQLHSAIPKELRNCMPNVNSWYQKSLQVDKIAPLTYRLINGIDDQNVIQKVVKWEHLFEQSFTYGDFLYQFRRVFLVTNVPKLRAFQYRLLHRAIPTNIQLHKWKMYDSELCSFCENEKETYVHLFLQCPIVSVLWRNVITFMSRYNNHAVTLTTKNVMLNEIVNPPSSIDNFICLLLKQYIYARRCMKQSLCFQEFQRYLRKIESIEKYIAIKNKKLDVHNSKWYKTPVISSNSQSQNFILDYIENL